MFIQGIDGQLEAIIESDQANQDFVILCHPHPQYGGSMHDGVVAILARSFAGRGVNSLRFNFRGVGASEATFDKGKGETMDVLSVINWCAAQYPDAGLYVAGYSFGAIMVINALQQIRPEIQLKGSVLVAPPTQMLQQPPEVNYPLLVIAGRQDAIVELANAETAFGADKVRVIDDCDHFFAGKDTQITHFVEEFIDAT